MTKTNFWENHYGNKLYQEIFIMDKLARAQKFRRLSSYDGVIA